MALAQRLEVGGSGSGSESESSQNRETLLEQRIWWQAVGDATRYGVNLRRELCAELVALEKGSACFEQWAEQCRTWTPIKLTVALESFSSMAGQPYLLRLMNALVKEVPSEVFDDELENSETPGTVSSFKQLASVHSLGQDECDMLESALSQSDGTVVSAWMPASWQWMHVFVSKRHLQHYLSFDYQYPHEYKPNLGRSCRARCSRGRGNHFQFCKASFAYSPALTLFKASSRQQAMMIRAFADCGTRSHVLTSTLGQGILIQAWLLENQCFFLDLVIDVVILIGLVDASASLRHYMYPSESVLAVLCLLAGRSCLHSLIIAWQHSQLFRGMDVYTSCLWKLQKFATAQNLFTMVLQIYSCCVLGWALVMVLDHGQKGCRGSRHAKSCHLFEYINLISFMIFFRWLTFVQNCLGIRTVGENVLPAFHAVSQPEALYFLLFLALIVLASFHAYYAFPTEDVDVHGGFGNVAWQEALSSFLRIFRLEVLADFDMGELEGRGEFLNASFKRGTIAAELEEDLPKPFHDGLRYMFVLLSLVVNVIMMNVYIGLLSSLYDAAKLEKRQIYFQFLANQAYRYVLLRSFWEELRGASKTHQAGELKRLDSAVEERDTDDDDEENDDNDDDLAWFIFEQHRVREDAC